MATKGFSESQIKKARQRAEDKAGFFSHLVVYILVISGLAVINALQDVGEWWFVWPAAMWGIGVLLHGAGVFILGGFIEEFTEDQTKRELEKMKKE